MPKPQKTASFIYVTEWAQHFLIRSSMAKCGSNNPHAIYAFETKQNGAENFLRAVLV